MTNFAMVPVVSVVREAEHQTTIRFDWGPSAGPGQFVMVWVPGIDEIPMSLSYVDGRKGITVREVGEATEALSSLEEGDLIGVRGPYGRGFSPRGRTLVVGGGVGTAAVIPCVERYDVDMVIGARTASELLFEERARASAGRVRVSTDDGTAGHEGNAVQLMGAMLREGDYDLVVACGPEVMLYHLHRACVDAGMDCQISLERYMKCGAGLCGSCAIDGMRVCADGPVFDRDQVSSMLEFGRWRRDASGRKVRL